MKKFLIVVDMQKDFVDGALGSKEALAIVDGVAEKIRGFEGEIFVTLDTHYENYMETAEGFKLPVPHCIEGQEGWQLDQKVKEALDGKRYTVVEKFTFGSVDLPNLIAEAAGEEDFTIEMLGLCTDICVVSNALILKAYFTEIPLSVHANLCAGVTPESHRAALQTMKMCQIDVLGQ